MIASRLEKTIRTNEARRRDATLRGKGHAKHAAHHTAARRAELGEQRAVVDQHGDRGGEGDEGDQAREDRTRETRRADLEREEPHVKAQVHALVLGDLRDASPHVAVGEARRQRLVADDAHHFGDEQHEKLQAHASETPTVGEEARARGRVEELAAQCAHEPGQDARVPSFFFDEQLERGAIVGVDAGELGPIDLVRDAPFTRLTEVEACERAREARGVRDLVARREAEGRREGARGVSFEVSAEVDEGRVHVGETDAAPRCFERVG